MKLVSPKGRRTRPIIGRVKESLFNVLYKYGMPKGKLVADLFCGTGSLGLEALSRGAVGVTFVEKNHKVVEILNRNIEKADFLNESKVITANAFAVGAASPGNARKYDLVFVDPPYADSERDCRCTHRAEKSPAKRIWNPIFQRNGKCKPCRIKDNREASVADNGRNTALQAGTR